MAQKEEVVVNIDGQNLYSRGLIAKGKEKAIEELTSKDGGIGKSPDWANKAWDAMVKAVDEKDNPKPEKKK